MAACRYNGFNKVKKLVVQPNFYSEKGAALRQGVHSTLPLLSPPTVLFLFFFSSITSNEHMLK